jgi:ubiquinone/menaquinone biosynthesis C-methylase UbiE
MKWLRTLRRSGRPQASSNQIHPSSLPPSFRYSIADLSVVESNYEKMFSMHRDIHEKIINDICKDSNSSVLEVACGPGHCIPLFRAQHINYTGMDISETAIAASAMKFCDIQLLNLSIEQSTILSPQSFDAVYNSSMLEHIGKFEEAIFAMWRLARRRMDLMFFEGLSDAAENAIRFFPYDRSETPESWGGEYGMKVALQDHGPRDGRTGSDPVPGYFYSRYAQRPMIELLRTLPDAVVSDVQTLVHAKHGPRSWITVRRA